ncbi:TadE/TadG family type IV pilus assembly protein [Haloechinothrix salitolerans]|uniref:TadE/TadG family type IV pilus assembly protein n=1 Tax=Haloechinothrix salitolerans TaxID=926830 RepID=A0ABW2BWV6_9PSEU
MVTTEFVLAVPALLLLLLVITQVAIWTHAIHVAQAAASQALAVARVQDASAADGQARAGAVLAQLGGGSLRDPHAVVTRGPTRSTVEVTGHAARVVPFLELSVHARAVGPRERFVPPEASG